jgi:hypothetical protein
LPRYAPKAQAIVLTIRPSRSARRSISNGAAYRDVTKDARTPAVNMASQRQSGCSQNGASKNGVGSPRCS